MISNYSGGGRALRMVVQIMLYSIILASNAYATTQTIDDGTYMDYIRIWNEMENTTAGDLILNQGIQSVNPMAFFSLGHIGKVSSYNDTIPRGSYLMGKNYKMSLRNFNDTSYTVLGNLEYTLQADNISSVSYPEYADWNSSYAKWVFPSNFSLDEGMTLEVEARKSLLNEQIVPLSISRRLNRSMFKEDGYQLAEFNFTFDDMNFKPQGGSISAYESSLINTSFVLDTFSTDAPLSQVRPFYLRNEHYIEFNFNTSKLEEKKTYNLSIVVKVDIRNNNSVSILYKPYYSIWLETWTQANDQMGYIATIPIEMLPKDVHYASASTNISNAWSIIQYNLLVAGLNGIAQPQIIIDLTMEPITSISPSNPLKASAFVSSNNLGSVEFGIVDINNLLSDNMTLLGVDINSSGINGMYFATWYANSFSIKKGNSQEIVTTAIFNRSDLLSYYGVIGSFKKNNTVDEVSAILWFERTTGVLSKITMNDDAFTPLSIENGLSVFKVVIFKFLQGGEKPPSQVNGSIYTLYNISNLSNPYLISNTIPNGIYRVFIHVSDKTGNNDGRSSDVQVGNTSAAAANNVCASLCHNYNKRLDRSVDFYPNALTSFDEYETFLGILNQMRDTPMNVTDPTIDFYYDPAELNGNSYDYFRKVQPSSRQIGHAFFEFQDMTLSNGNGTFGADKGERTDTNGFDVTRKVENNGLITEDGYLNVTVSAVLYEKVNNYIALSAGLWNSSEFNVWVVNWTSSEPVDYQDIRPDNVFVHFGTQGDILPRRYDLNVTFYVDRIIPANITLKPWVSVNTRNNLQHSETHGSGVTINGTMFNMNSTFRSSNDNLTWIAEEGYEKRIELEGGITEILEPYAEFEFNKDLAVETRNDSLNSGSYEKNLQYSMNINNKEDSSKTILGDLKFNAQADNITGVGWRQYSNWNLTYAKWAFPSDFVVKENDGLGTNLITNFYEPGYLNVDISRQMNKTVFITEGYQLAKFNVTFKDKNFEWAWARLEANNQYGVDAFVVPGSFTNDNNAPGHFGEWEHGVQFDFDKELMQTGVNYNFSVILRVRPNEQRAPPIIHKPGFIIGERLYSSSADGGKGKEVEIPSSMLPEHISLVSASTNTSSAWLVRRQNLTTAELQDVSDITGPHAEFIISKDLVISTENDYLSSGNYKTNLSYYLNIYNEDDDSDTTLGDITLSARAQNITGAGWGQYAVWNGTSVNWTFPTDQVIRENEGFGAGFGTDNSGSRYLGINVSRWMNRTNFTGEGYQFARFGVTFLNKDFQGIWGNINAHDLSGVEASIVPGTFVSEAPLNWKEEKMQGVNFNINKGGIQTGIQYNFSIIIRVNNTRNSPVQFKPEFTIGEELSFNATSGGEGYSVEIPFSMLPSNVSQVLATVNISNAWRVGQKYQHIARLTGDRTPPVITYFEVEPNISVSGSNPAIARAYVSDEGLQNVAFGIIDSGDLINKNSTVLGFFVNESGINGKYVAPWYAKSWSLTNGSMNETVTIIEHADHQDYLFVFGMFRKNATSIEEEAVLWFNSSTGILVNITVRGPTLTPLQIENGNSTFMPSISRFIDGLNKPPVEIPGRTFNLYSPENPENPYITMTSVPPGIYKMFVHAVDISGNENGDVRDVGAGQGIPPVANCGPGKLRCENVGYPVKFNASASYDPDGFIVSYNWDFGDGTNDTGVAPVHKYSTYKWNGTAYQPFTVNLTVADNKGLTNSTSQKVIIWIAGDSNGDGRVNIIDASLVGIKWSTTDPCADLNNDGKVNILDASIIGLNWGKSA